MILRSRIYQRTTDYDRKWKEKQLTVQILRMKRMLPSALCADKPLVQVNQNLCRH